MSILSFTSSFALTLRLQDKPLKDERTFDIRIYTGHIVRIVMIVQFALSALLGRKIDHSGVCL